MAKKRKSHKAKTTAKTTTHKRGRKKGSKSKLRVLRRSRCLQRQRFQMQLRFSSPQNLKSDYQYRVSWFIHTTIDT